MDRTKSSTLIKPPNPKPVNVFYVWYTELCRRLNITPAPAVKPAKPKCQTVLDFVADRLKIEEWTPVLSALRHDTSLHVVAIRSRIGNCQFLHDIDTEEKAKSTKRKYGSIWTAYVLKQLLNSISYSLRSTQVLTYLELDGLPLFMQYLEPLLQALKRNKTLKNLSFSNCSIEDSGCQLVCSYLRFTPNIEAINLSGCHLSPISGEHLAKLIKYQQINRYCESWHSSLRYENPDAGKMRGLKRITINCNPFFGDSGLSPILTELEDDLWVKALDMQRCGFTEDIAERVVDVVQYNKNLEIFDLRQNDSLSITTVERVLQILKQRQQFGAPAEFQWCATAVTLTWSTVYSATSKASFVVPPKVVHKTRSAPLKPASSKVSAVTWDPAVRKSKTLEVIQNKNGLSLNETKKQVLELNEKLQKEILKRKEIEKRNVELQTQLNQIRRTSSSADRYPTRQRKEDVHKSSSKKGEMAVVKAKHVNVNNKTNPLVIRRKEPRNADNVAPLKNGFHKNGFKKPSENKSVYEILDQLLNTGQPLDENVEDEVLSYFAPFKQNNSRDSKLARGSLSISNSQESLYKYMEELKAKT